MRTMVTPLPASHADTLAHPAGSRSSQPRRAIAGMTTRGRLFRATRSTSPARSVFALSSASSAAVGVGVAPPASLRGSGDCESSPMISSGSPRGDQCPTHTGQDPWLDSLSSLPSVFLVSLVLFMSSPPVAFGEEDTRGQQLGEH